jgi:hypothetical protein
MILLNDTWSLFRRECWDLSPGWSNLEPKRGSHCVPSTDRYQHTGRCRCCLVVECSVPRSCTAPRWCLSRDSLQVVPVGASSHLTRTLAGQRFCLLDPSPEKLRAELAFVPARLVCDFESHPGIHTSARRPIPFNESSLMRSPFWMDVLNIGISFKEVRSCAAEIKVCQWIDIPPYLTRTLGATATSWVTQTRWNQGLLKRSSIARHPGDLSRI